MSKEFSMSKAANLVSVLKSAPAIVGSAMLTAGVVALSAPAQAFVIGCPSNIADHVSSTSACQYSSNQNNDSVASNRPLTVNEEAFFGFTDWKFSSKPSTSSSGQLGDWNISSLIQNTWSDAMLIFKSGANTTLVGYKLTPGVTFGTWNSPFEKSLFTSLRNTRDVSHISVYYREGAVTPPTAAVPEPTTMAGLALAGAGFAAMRRRQAAKA
jgi:hypothetical protein